MIKLKPEMLSVLKLKMRELGKIAVVYGGNSAEREISIQSGQHVASVMSKCKANAVDYCVDKIDKKIIERLADDGIDLVFIMLHGGAGENGAFQSLLESAKIAYTGSSANACRLAMDKWQAKRIWQQEGLPTPKFEVLTPSKIDNDQSIKTILKSMNGKAVIKPSCEGSSNGINIVVSSRELKAAYNDAQRYTKEGGKVLAEEYIQGRELTYSVLNKEVLSAVEIVVRNGFYDYHHKYQSNATRYINPPVLNLKFDRQLRKLAFNAFDSLGCQHWGRVDLIVDKDNNPYLIEVNTVPGMTAKSLVPMAAHASGIAMAQLIVSIGQLGRNRYPFVRGRT